MRLRLSPQSRIDPKTLGPANSHTRDQGHGIASSDRAQTDEINSSRYGERYCQFGRLLPAIEDIDTDDIAAITEARLILQEMAETKSAMDALLGPSI